MKFKEKNKVLRSRDLDCHPNFIKIRAITKYDMLTLLLFLRK